MYQPLLDVANSEKWVNCFKNPNQKPWYPWNIDGFQELLSNAHLEPVELYVWNKITSSASRSDFIAFLKGWLMAVPHLAELPLDKRDEFIEDVADHFLQSVAIKPDGSFEYVTPYLMVKAKKKLNPA